MRSAFLTKVAHCGKKKIWKSFRKEAEKQLPLLETYKEWKLTNQKVFCFCQES